MLGLGDGLEGTVGAGRLGIYLNEVGGVARRFCSPLLLGALGLGADGVPKDGLGRLMTGGLLRKIDDGARLICGLGDGCDERELDDRLGADIRLNDDIPPMLPRFVNDCEGALRGMLGRLGAGADALADDARLLLAREDDSPPPADGPRTKATATTRAVPTARTVLFSPALNIVVLLSFPGGPYRQASNWGPRCTIPRWGSPPIHFAAGIRHAHPARAIG